MSVPTDQMQTGLQGAVEAGIATGDAAATPDAELAEVKKLNTEYKVAREFDKEARKQYNRDRRYAQGVADPNWASDANIIGSFIDILVSFLYAKDPDVSVRAAARAGGQPDHDATLFAETMQIVVSRLWRDAKLKRVMRKMVRSGLSVGVGWMKALVYSSTRRNPEIEKQIHDAQDNIARVTELKRMLGEGADTTEQDALLTELQNQMTGLTANVEMIVKQGMCLDFCRAEDLQVSLDITDTADYLDADWISNDMYIRKELLGTRFPRFTEEDCKTAAIYFQRQTGANAKDANVAAARMDNQPEGQFSTDGGGGSVSLGGEKPIEFVKVVELWDHRDSLIKTFVDGVKKWAVEPYPPPQASERFYPYFRLAFFETDGSRHPQSLSWRMAKLQDEYSAARSGGRKTRERSIPGTVFNRGQLSEEDATKLEKSDHLEMVGLMPTNPDLPLDKIITAKPVPRVDPMLFDTAAIQRDMQIVSGVQEAQQQAITSSKTATEAEIQQSGFASRTGADRDMEEQMLTELAQYTAQLAIQSIDPMMAQKIAGPLAFWPAGMSVDDILTMVNVDIAAGTTGKPQAHADKETWATLLPLIQQMMVSIQEKSISNPPLAVGERNLLRETLRRLDDRLDVDDILPQGPPAPSPPPPPQVKISLSGQLPPADAQVLAGLPPTGPTTLPAPGGGGAAGGPPVGNGTVNNPGAQAPPSS